MVEVDALSWYGSKHYLEMLSLIEYLFEAPQKF